MATAEKQKAQQDEQELREVIAKASKFYQQYDGFGNRLNAFVKDYQSIKSDVIRLLNAQELMDRLVKEAIVKVSDAEREAQIRLSSVEQGHRALIDRLSKQQVELTTKQAEVEKKERELADARHKVELMREEYERRMAGAARIGAK